jgi:hypothetical protein
MFTMARQLNKCSTKTPGKKASSLHALNQFYMRVTFIEYSESYISRFIVMSTELFGPIFVKAIFTTLEVELAKALT